MKNLWLLFALALSSTAFGQQVPATANLTAQDSGACTTANACLSVNIPVAGASAVIQLSGTWTATVQFEASTGSGPHGSPFTAITGTPVGGTGAISSSTGPGAWRFNVASVYVIRARVSTYGGGVVEAAITASTASSFSGGGGGGGGGTGTITGSGTAGNYAQWDGSTDLTNAPTINAGGVTLNSQPVSQPSSLYPCTNSASGTSNGFLVVRDAAGNCITNPAANQNYIRGVVFSGGGTSGSSLICKIGSCPIVLDNSSTINDCIVASATGGQGHDAGPVPCPNGSQQIGLAQSVNSGPGTAAQVDVFIFDTQPGPTGGSQTLEVNGTIVAGTLDNLNNSTPSAPATFLNCNFQTDNAQPTSNISVACPEASTSQLGFLELTQDLGGAALTPVVQGIQTIPVTFTSIAAGDNICFPTTSTLANCHPGVPIRTFSTGSDTMLASDRTGWVRPTTSGTVAESLPQAGSAGFTSNYVFGTLNNATGIDTITPTTSTINGSSTAAIYPGWFALTTSDNTNYFSAIMPTVSGFPACPDTTGNHLNFTTAAGLSCGTSGGGGGGGGTVTSVAVSSPISASPSPITSTGTISCPTCVTAAASLTSTSLVAGAGGQAVAVITTPTQCSAGQAATGITATGAANGCFTAASGTVTSVAQTVPSWLSIGGSPITTSGTLAITAATGQTSHQVIGTCGSATSFAPCTLVAGDIPSAVRTHGLVFSYGDPGNSTAITAGSTATDYITVPFACTISAYNILVDAGTITIKFWKVATGTAIPTSGNSISTSGVSISSGTAIHSTTVTDFTSTTVSANDIIAMNVSTVATAKFVSATLECDQ